jgi:hypothetical protein
VALLDEIGRACDVRAADFNQDGRLDLAAAEFGWHLNGGIHLLIQQEPTGNGQLSFEHRKLDDRAGVVHLITNDFDGDDKLDLLALFSQQYESIEFISNPHESWQTRQWHRLWEAGDPGFGSSGVAHADGDLDLLYSHGDTFDGPYVKASHGVHLLENLGSLNYQARRLAYLPGAYSATAADWDLDGDLDIAVSAWLPSETRQFDREQAISLLLLERTGPTSFQHHVLERGNPVHASIRLADIDGDGDPDLISGHDDERVDKPALLDLWINQTRSPTRAPVSAR